MLLLFVVLVFLTYTNTYDKNYNICLTESYFWIASNILNRIVVSHILFLGGNSLSSCTSPSTRYVSWDLCIVYTVKNYTFDMFVIWQYLFISQYSAQDHTLVKCVTLLVVGNILVPNIIFVFTVDIRNIKTSSLIFDLVWDRIIFDLHGSSLSKYCHQG